MDSGVSSWHWHTDQSAGTYYWRYTSGGRGMSPKAAGSAASAFVLLEHGIREVHSSSTRSGKTRQHRLVN